jgi:hypothetical protein
VLDCVLGGAFGLLATTLDNNTGIQLGSAAPIENPPTPSATAVSRKLTNF